MQNQQFTKCNHKPQLSSLVSTIKKNTFEVSNLIEVSNGEATLPQYEDKKEGDELEFMETC
jgi:hypothetical protein